MLIRDEIILDPAAPLPANVEPPAGPLCRSVLIGDIHIDERVRPLWLAPGRGTAMPVCGVREPAPGVDALIWLERNRDRFPLAANRGNGRVRLYFDARATFEHILFEGYRPPVRVPAMARAPFDYHKIPGSVRGAAARAITIARMRAQAPASWWRPRFPVEIAPTVLHHALCLCAGSQPPSQEITVILTHDVDEASSVRGAGALAEIESARGLRSAWFVAGKLFRGSRDWIRSLVATGHEIGLHGLRHDFRFAFLPEARLRAELDSASQWIEEFGIRGFRSPHYLRTETMLRVLAERFAYDSSVPDCDAFSPCAPGGCGIPRPFMRKGLLEIPVTLPFEIPWMKGTAPERLAEFWRGKLDFCRDSGGVVVVNTHPDAHASGNRRMRAAYARLLDELRSRGARFLPPGDIAQMRNGNHGHA